MFFFVSPAVAIRVAVRAEVLRQQDVVHHILASRFAFKEAFITHDEQQARKESSAAFDVVESRGIFKEIPFTFGCVTEQDFLHTSKQ